MIKSKEELLQDFWESPNVKKYTKVSVVIIGAITAIYVTGYVFKIFAHTIRGYNELKSACQKTN